MVAVNMKPQQEYKILPQNERDNVSNTLIGQRSSSTTRYSCCCQIFAILGALIILGGLTGLTVKLLYPDQFTTVVTDYWVGEKHEGNGTEVTDDLVSVVNATFVTPGKPKPLDKDKGKNSKENDKNQTADLVPTTAAPKVVTESTLDNNGTDVAPNTNVTSSGEDSADTSGDEDAQDESEEDSEETTSVEETTTTTTKAPPVVEKPEKTSGEKGKDKGKGKRKSDKKNENDSKMKPGHEPVNKTNDWQDDVELYVENTEKFLEDATGIRRAEIVVPLFMFVCFLLSLLMASCCCYLLMRRRDNRRRRVLGKIITDLHTGDSKSILLDQDIDD